MGKFGAFVPGEICEAGLLGERTTSLFGNALDETVGAVHRKVDGLGLGTDAPISEGEQVQQYKTIEVTVENDVTIVCFTDECLASGNVENFANDLHQLEATQPAKIVIDLSHVQSLISSMTGQLVWLKKSVDKRNGVLRLAELQPVVGEILNRLRLDKFFGIHDSKKQAIAALTEQRA